MTLNFVFSLLFVASFSSQLARGFLVRNNHDNGAAVQTCRKRHIQLSESVTKVEETSSTTPRSSLSIPRSWDEMVRQVATTMKQAAARGDRRQIVRILLPRDSTSGDFGKYLEYESLAGESSGVTSITLVPPDESWQGGIMQLYRSAAPTAQRIIQAFLRDSEGGVPPRIMEDRSVDESGVDGVSFFQTSDKQVSCWLQPMQDNVNDIIDKTEKMNKKNPNNNSIVALLNPQWRLVDDALDTASKTGGFFGGLAGFLGGKGGTLRRLKDAGFVPVYTLEGYVCRGANVRLLQVLDSDWSVFCERDNGESFIPVGTLSQRPTYQEVDQMLNDANIGYKYARDIGMSPKL